jgi:hypothetical protein
MLKLVCMAQLVSLAVCVEEGVGGSTCAQILRQGKCKADGASNLRTVSECVDCSSRSKHEKVACSADLISSFCFPPLELLNTRNLGSCFHQLEYSSCKPSEGGFKEEVEEYDKTHQNGNNQLLKTYEQLEKIDELTHKDPGKLKHEIAVLETTEHRSGCIPCVQDHMLVLGKILLRVIESGGSGQICTSSDIKAFCTPRQSASASASAAVHEIIEGDQAGGYSGHTGRKDPVLKKAKPKRLTVSKGLDTFPACATELSGICIPGANKPAEIEQCVKCAGRQARISRSTAKSSACSQTNVMEFCILKPTDIDYAAQHARRTKDKKRIAELRRKAGTPRSCSDVLGKSTCQVSSEARDSNAQSALRVVVSADAVPLARCIICATKATGVKGAQDDDLNDLNGGGGNGGVGCTTEEIANFCVGGDRGLLAAAAAGGTTHHSPNYPPNQCGEFTKKVCAHEATDSIQGIIGGSRDRCVKCIKEKVVGGSAVICALSDVAQVCGVSEKGRSKEETLMCEKQLQKRCSKVATYGPKCNECVKAHIGTIDGALAGEGMCSKFQINHFCYFHGEGEVSMAEVSLPINYPGYQPLSTIDV